MQCTSNTCGCPHHGETLRYGQVVPSTTDTCNTCTCQSTGQVDCTNNPCGCQHMGRMLNFGQTINQDECNTCTCQQNGQVSCTSNPNPCNCKYGTMTLAIGQSMKKDECNMCTCQSNGQVSCTNKPCSCTYNGNRTSAQLAPASKRHLATLHPAGRTQDAKCKEKMWTEKKKKMRMKEIISEDR